MDFGKDFTMTVRLLPLEFLKTVYMVLASSAASLFLGFFLGVFGLLALQGPRWMRCIDKAVGILMSFFVSVPFSILIIFLLPVTKLIIGTGLGSTASIVPLTLGSLPFVTKLFRETCRPVYKAFREVAFSTGGSSLQTIFGIVLPECVPALVSGFKSIVICILGFSALAGFVGGGGLGQLIMQYGYYRFNACLVVAVVLATLLIVEVINLTCDFFADRILKKRGL